VPPNIHVEQWIDQHRILEHAALVVCHGGSGTVFGSIDAGVPLVVLPSFSDQFANGRLVERHGVGLTVEAAPGETGRRPLGESDVVRITNAIETVLGQATFSDRAGAIAEEISAAPSALEVIDRLAG
jgi:UDP:flavonoid glycosyltransferase YjiC (YdhE family)